jgi:hypothetical protein
VNQIKIENTNVTVDFQGMNINTSAAVVISASSVTIVGKETNTMTSMGARNAGIQCSVGSNITIQADGESSFFVTGGENSAGIGTGGNGM